MGWADARTVRFIVTQPFAIFKVVVYPLKIWCPERNEVKQVIQSTN
ncbi:hypothetical protein AVDCRST_MAG81-1396 [uncultured Synechococcales cyanobacterium]|uniref:Uncharacterized protein n=1 Tax=uncultured Synechococcales cyanobacterium TaxID=1936017 RepID=A0A6J4V544_9CYAN|nr:hypothetical protein AVDCRST_MAG81-1396 [uncultured Synechococcales cyanobacterium]